MRKILIISAIALFTGASYAEKCGMAEYIGGDTCTQIDTGYYGVPCHADLPAEYTELEYIQSTGKQWIDTGYVPNDTTEVFIKYEYTKQPTSDAYAGVFGNDFISVDTNLTAIRMWGSEQWMAVHNMKNDGGWEEFDMRMKDVVYTDYMGYGKYISNDIEYTLQTPESHPKNKGETNTTTIHLFRTIRGVPDLFGLRIYSAHFVDNNRYVRDMVPARRNSDGVLGMYDLINDVFHVNGNTGNFIAGNPLDCISQAPCEPGYYCINGGHRHCFNAPANSVYTTDLWTTTQCPWVCNENYVQTAIDTCGALCTAGATKLRTGTGINIPLFASKNTTLAINIGLNGNVCYADLVSGQSTDAINIQYNNQTYHTVSP